MLIDPVSEGILSDFTVRRGLAFYKGLWSSNDHWHAASARRGNQVTKDGFGICGFRLSITLPCNS